MDPTSPLPLTSVLCAGDPVALTGALVSIPSVNPELEAHGAGEEAAARFCGALLREWGFQVQLTSWAPGRMDVVARWGSGPPSLLLNGHLDTVGVGDMSIQPYDPVLRRGRLYGRGSCDMKGGVAAILSAAREVARSGDPPRGELLIALTSDEEHASRGLRALLDGGLRADAAVVCEPTSLEVMPANKGFAWWEVEFRGRAAHGSRPDEGRDAIRAAGRFLTGLDQVERRLQEGPPHPRLGRASLHAGTIRGGTAPSVYPARCHLVLEARTLPGTPPHLLAESLEELRGGLRETAPGVEVTLRPGLARPPGDLPEDHPLVGALRAACRDQGVPDRVGGMTAWVEAAWLQEAGIPAVCFGPGSIADAHTDAESVPVEELHQAARVLESLIRSGVSQDG